MFMVVTVHEDKTTWTLFEILDSDKLTMGC